MTDHTFLSQGDNAVYFANNEYNKAFLKAAATLSSLGSIITILTYALNKDIRTMSRHIIVCISVADLVTCMANLVGIFIIPTTKNTTGAACQIQSFISTTAVLSSFLWTLMLSVYLYIVIVKERLKYAKNMVRPWGHLFCWLLPLGINVTALTTRNLGNDGDITTAGWCWIKMVHDDGSMRERSTILLWMFIDGKGIEIIACFIILFICIFIKLHLKYKIQCSIRRESPYGTFLTQKTMVAAKKADRKLIFIPVIMILLRIWGTIRFFIYVSNIQSVIPSNISEALLYLHTLGDNLQGAMNCLLFCFFTPKVFYHIKNGCGMILHNTVQCCCCCGWCRDSSTCAYKRIDGVRDGISDDSEEGMTPS